MLEDFHEINSHFPWFFRTLAFVFGAVTGSFLNVCIYRIPAERSVVFPGSTCACGKPIRWYDNIPILSWILLRGRARCCGESFSFRYPAVELLTGLLFLGAWMGHPPAVALAGMLFIAFLICATFIDLDHMIIPDRFSIGGAVIGVALSFAIPGIHAVEAGGLVGHLQSGILAIIGMVTGAGLVYWIAILGEIVFRKPAMGEGDVKFVGFIGAFCGWQGAVFAMFGGAVIGSVILLPLLLLQRVTGPRGEPDTPPPDPARAIADAVAADAEEDVIEEDVALGGQIPFGPMLALAGLLYFLGLSAAVDAYFENFSVVFGGP